MCCPEIDLNFLELIRFSSALITHQWWDISERIGCESCFFALSGTDFMPNKSFPMMYNVGHWSYFLSPHLLSWLNLVKLIVKTWQFIQLFFAGYFILFLFLLPLMHDFLRVRYQRHDSPVLGGAQHCGVYPGVAPPTSHQVPLGVAPDSQLAASHPFSMDVHFLHVLTNLPTTAYTFVCLTHNPGRLQSHTQLSADGSFIPFQYSHDPGNIDLLWVL